MTSRPTPSPTSSSAAAGGAAAAGRESGSFRALRILSACEGVSFVLLLVCSVLKRTTGPDLVPVMGPVHGVLFVAAVVLVLANYGRLRWGVLFTVVMLTIGSPGLHFPVVASQRAER